MYRIRPFQTLKQKTLWTSLFSELGRVGSDAVNGSQTLAIVPSTVLSQFWVLCRERKKQRSEIRILNKKEPVARQ